MAREKEIERDKTRDSASARTGTSPTDASEQSRTERERGIATGRELGRERPGTLSRPTPVYGAISSPFSVMRRMAEDMDRLFDTFAFGRTGLGPQPSLRSVFDDDFGLTEPQRSLWSPQVEVFQRGDKIVVRADLPGMTKDDVNVEVNDNVLTLSGERKYEAEEDREGFYRSERSYGQFYRAIPLPEGVNAEKVDASFNNAVLEISIPTPQEQQRKGKRINVR